MGFAANSMRAIEIKIIRMKKLFVLYFIILIIGAVSEEKENPSELKEIPEVTEEPNNFQKVSTEVREEGLTIPKLKVEG